MRDVAASVYGQAAKKFSVQGFGVTATFETRSRKGTWDADYFFNAETGHYRCTRPYGATSPSTFGNEIQRRILEALAN
ncbi:hypothetical protein ACFTY8_46580 [Streptomyces mirabilis]|uniref:hypothetical protein n=1 Tax=Streptomyces mirabilis TaxID=68239 RepID=UPI00363603B7